MRDVNSGWAIRYTHANVASFFFIFVYAQLNFLLSIIIKDLKRLLFYIKTNKISEIIFDVLNSIIYSENSSTNNNQEVHFPSKGPVENYSNTSKFPVNSSLYSYEVNLIQFSAPSLA
jgi:hypothetical protein